MRISLVAPVTDPTGLWYCQYTIDGPGLPLGRRVAGADSLQALILALHELRITLKVSHPAVEWDGRDLDFAFPGMHDLSRYAR